MREVDSSRFAGCWHCVRVPLLATGNAYFKGQFIGWKAVTVASRSGNRAIFKSYEGLLVSRPIQLYLLAAGNYGISVPLSWIIEQRSIPNTSHSTLLLARSKFWNTSILECFFRIIKTDSSRV